MALLWEDPDVENRILSVSKQVVRVNGDLEVTEPKTQNSIRKVALPQQTVDLLIQEHEKHPDNPLMSHLQNRDILDSGRYLTDQ